jgi:hypothetical protein
MQNGVCWGLTTLGRRTEGNGCGYLPTPQASDATVGAVLNEKTDIYFLKSGMPRKVSNQGVDGSIGLARMVKMWPTPKGSPSGPDFARMNRDGSGGDDLATAVAKNFPTPKQRDWKGKTQRGTHAQMDGLCNTLDVTGGQLNPTWVELLMGWPKDWTCLNPISHIQYLQWLMGGIENEETRRSETMRMLRIGNVAEEVSRTIGRLVGIPEAAVLLSQLCEHEKRFDEARIFMACAETLEEEMRSVRIQQGVTGAPSGSEYQKQRTGEYSDVMQTLSRLLAHYGETHWKDGSWENGIPRVAAGVASRVDRLKAIGNGQVPSVVATAWRILGGSDAKN